MKEVIAKYEAMPFRYGADCCQFVGECVESLRGYNPTNEFSYRTKDEADELIAGYGSLEDLCTTQFGPPCFYPKDGDIALYDQIDGSQIVGIVSGDDVILRAVRGLVRWPLIDAKKVWST